MHISFGGIAALLFFVALVFVLVKLTSKGENGSNFSFADLKNLRHRNEKPGDSENKVRCLNNYPDKYVLEYIDKDKVAADADSWEIGGKECFFQNIINNVSSRIELPTESKYPTERLARLMGCEPLRKLKSLKFGILDKLAPFAPVAAIGILAILMIMLKG